MTRLLVAIVLIAGAAGCTEAQRPEWLNEANANFERNMAQRPGGTMGWAADAVTATEMINASHRLRR